MKHRAIVLTIFMLITSIQAQISCGGNPSNLQTGSFLLIKAPSPPMHLASPMAKDIVPSMYL